MDIAQLGYSVDSSELAQGTTALDKHAVAAGRTGTAATKLEGQSKRLALSQRELLFAQRQLPMQFTDIFTSIQAGQNPMQVFLQQGGQLKDTFGGIGPALRASAGYVMGLVNPLTLAAGAVGGLAIAWNAAEQRNTAFNKSIILTGNYVGTTAEQMAAMAAEMDALAGVTEGSASEALAKVAATGRFTAEQFALVTSSAEQMRASAGVAIDDTIDKFVAIGKDPVDALLKLNVTEHLVTDTQLDRIRALQDEGREQEAVTEALRIYGREGVARAKEVEASLSSIPSLWREIKQGTLESGDAIVNWAGDVDRSFGKALNSLARYRMEQDGLYRKFLDVYFDQGDAFAGVTTTGSSTAQAGGAAADSEAYRERMNAEKAAEDAINRQVQAVYGLDTAVNKLEMSFGAMSEKRQKALVADGTYTALLNRAMEEDAKRAAGGRKPSERDTGATLLSRIQQQIALNDEQLSSQEKLTESDRIRVQVEALLASSKAKVTQATREQMSVGLAQLQQDERYREVMEVNALIDEQAAEAQRELAEATEKRRLTISSLLSDIEAEIELSRLSGVEKEKAIALRYANVNAVSAEGLAISEAAERLYKAREAETVLNDVKGATLDFAVTAASNFENAGDAFEDFTDRMKQLAIQLLAEKAIQALAGYFGGIFGGGQSAAPSTGSAFAYNGSAGYSSGYGSGWADGGYTGHGGKYEAAGMVHKGEYVINAGSTAKLGRGFLDRLNGYAAGGYVSPVQAVAPARGTGMGTPNVEINIQNAPAGLEKSGARMRPDGMLEVLIQFKDQVKGEMAGEMASGTGSMYTATKGRFNLRDAV